MVDVSPRSRCRRLDDQDEEDGKEDATKTTETTITTSRGCHRVSQHGCKATTNRPLDDDDDDDDDDGK